MLLVPVPMPICAAKQRQLGTEDTRALGCLHEGVLTGC